jgi:general secretion pathway protein M
MKLGERLRTMVAAVVARARVTPLLDRLGLNPRERRLVVVLTSVAAAGLLLAGPVLFEVYVRGRRAEADDTRKAIDELQDARTAIRDRQAKKDSVIARYAKKAPNLASYLEELASAQKLKITDSQDRPEVPHGKRYTERQTVIHFRKAGMGPVAKFGEALEQSGHPVVISRLNLRKRPSETDSFDLEVGVSAYDRSDTPRKDKDAK